MVSRSTFSTSHLNLPVSLRRSWEEEKTRSMRREFGGRVSHSTVKVSRRGGVAVHTSPGSNDTKGIKGDKRLEVLYTTSPGEDEETMLD